MKQSRNASLSTGLSRIQCLSGNQLKWIAAVCMLADHFSKTVWVAYSQTFLNPKAAAGVPFSAAETALEALNGLAGPVGAIAFPLFCFLFVEGYQHTHDRKELFFRLSLFAFLSEFPFDLAFFSDTNRMQTTGFYWYFQNVFFTYLMGMLTLFLLEQAQAKQRKIPAVLLQGFLAASMCLLAEELVSNDYGGFGVALILVFYLLRRSRLLQLAGGMLLMLLLTPNYTAARILALALLLLYDGTRGKKNQKYFFYIFYPVHLVLLHLLVLLVRSCA